MKKQLFLGFTLALFTITLLLAGYASAEEADYLLEQETIITGMVEQKGDAFILQAIDGEEYTMTGQDLADMVGKKVQATGELSLDKDKSNFNVNEIIEIQYDEMALDKSPDLIIPLESGQQ